MAEVNYRTCMLCLQIATEIPAPEYSEHLDAHFRDFEKIIEQKREEHKNCCLKEINECFEKCQKEYEQRHTVQVQVQVQDLDIPSKRRFELEQKDLSAEEGPSQSKQTKF